jgi:hypothetical protein
VKRAATKEEQAHMDAVRELGCLICERPAAIHHTRCGQGAGQRASHFSVLPLCADHHQNGGHGVAFHAGKKTWQERYGTEQELLERVKEKLNVV